MYNNTALQAIIPVPKGGISGLIKQYSPVTGTFTPELFEALRWFLLTPRGRWPSS